MNFPQAPIAANPFVPDTTNYEARAERLGSKFSNLASNVGNLAEKISAYETLKKKMEDKQRFKAELLGNVINLMKQHGGYGEKDISLASQAILNEDATPDESFMKGMALKKNIDKQKEMGIDTIPVYGESPEGYEARTKSTWAAKIGRTHLEGMGTGTKAQQTKNALLAGGGKDPSEALKTVLNETPDDLSEYQRKYLDAQKVKGSKPPNVSAFIDKNVKNSLSKAQKLKGKPTGFADAIAEAEIWQEVMSDPNVTDEKTAKDKFNTLYDDPTNGVHVRAQNYIRKRDALSPVEQEGFFDKIFNAFSGKKDVPAGASNTTQAPTGW